MAKKEDIQKTLFGEEIVTSYESITAWGETITIPNFQPVSEEENDRLDYKKQFSILVHLDTEEERDALYNVLKDKGFKCRKN